MRLTSKRYEEIKLLVASLYEKLDIRSIPIDCHEIACKMNVKLIPYSQLTESGRKEALAISEDGFSALVEEGMAPFVCNQWYIYYNDQRPKARIRFTIMHELGHIKLDHTEASDLAESEANFFAKYALAPPVLVHLTQPEDYLDIAESFDLTIEFASYAMSYYQKWLKYGGAYKQFEIRMIEQFEDVV